MDTLYLDHAATAPPLPEALAAFQKAAREAFANPGSLHQAGADAARSLEKSRRGLANAFGAQNYSLIWTGTGTESNHLAIQGLARRQKDTSANPTILVGAAEHPAARMAAEALQEEGFCVKIIPVNAHGLVKTEALLEQLSADVVLVSVQWANNEIGGLNPIADLVQVTRAHSSALFHVDAIQAVGKRKEWLDDLDADAISVAAHKIGGVRGCAALFLHKNCPKPVPMFVGGGHEGGLRAGTENVMGAAAFCEAARIRQAGLHKNGEIYHQRRHNLLEQLQKVRPDLVVLGPENPAEVQGSILTVAFPGTKAEPLLHQFEAAGIQVGSGSACNAKGHAESPVLAAIGLAKNLRNSVIRFSLDGTESEKDLSRVAKVLIKASESTS